MHARNPGRPVAHGPLVLMALARSGVSPRLLAALAGGRAAQDPARRRVLHPVASTGERPEEAR